jgi:hypothetical protein
MISRRVRSRAFQCSSKLHTCSFNAPIRTSIQLDQAKNTVAPPLAVNIARFCGQDAAAVIEGTLAHDIRAFGDETEGSVVAIAIFSDRALVEPAMAAVKSVDSARHCVVGAVASSAFPAVSASEYWCASAIMVLPPHIEVSTFTLEEPAFPPFTEEELREAISDPRCCPSVLLMHSAGFDAKTCLDHVSSFFPFGLQHAFQTDGTSTCFDLLDVGTTRTGGQVDSEDYTGNICADLDGVIFPDNISVGLNIRRRQAALEGGWHDSFLPFLLALPTSLFSSPHVSYPPTLSRSTASGPLFPSLPPRFSGEAANTSWSTAAVAQLLMEASFGGSYRSTLVSKWAAGNVHTMGDMEQIYAGGLISRSRFRFRIHPFTRILAVPDPFQYFKSSHLPHQVLIIPFTSCSPFLPPRYTTAANQRFYHAFESGDMLGMEEVWAGEGDGGGDSVGDGEGGSGGEGEGDPTATGPTSDFSLDACDEAYGDLGNSAAAADGSNGSDDNDAGITCTHPGMKLLRGRGRVMDSWSSIVDSNGEMSESEDSGRSMVLDIDEVQVQHTPGDSVGFVTLTETLHFPHASAGT